MQSVVLVVFFVGLQLVVARQFDQQSFFATRSFTSGKCNSTKPVCDTCNSYTECIGSIALGSISCPIDKQYCDNGVCVANVTVGCEAAPQPNTITCSDVGFFPDPYNCSKFHYCKEKAKYSFPMECRTNFVFNEKNLVPFCRRAVNNADCIKIACGPKSGYVPYGTTSSRHYAFCSVGSTQTQILILSCPKDTVYGKTGECVPDCKKEGERYMLSNTTYYECFKPTATAIMSFDINECPKGTKFDVDSQNCIV